MSLLYAYHRKNIAVVASDDLVSVEQDGKHIACEEKRSKFQVLTAKDKPVVLGVVGRADLAELLHANIPRVVADQKYGLQEIVAVMPHVLQPLIKNRPPSTISPERDGVQVAAIGFDTIEQRVRAFLFFAGADGMQQVETTSDLNNCFFALGWLQEPNADLQKFSEYLGRNGSSMGPNWIARELRRRIDRNSQSYPGQVGAGKYFAAIDHWGTVGLATDLHAPTLAEVTAAPAGGEMAVAGTYRYYVGSILTPQAGQPDTTGNNDGGTGAQIGGLTILGFQDIAFNSGGTNPIATCTNLPNANDGDYSSFATLSTADSGGSALSTGQILWTAPPPLNQKTQSLTVTILYKVTTNSLSPGNLSPLTGVTIGVAYGISGRASTTVSPPTTNSRIQSATFTIPNPSTVNLTTVQAFVNVESFEDTSGSVSAEVFGAFISAVQ
jgi:hypothetical protein